MPCFSLALNTEASVYSDGFHFLFYSKRVNVQLAARNEGTSPLGTLWLCPELCGHLHCIPVEPHHMLLSSRADSPEETDSCVLGSDRFSELFSRAPVRKDRAQEASAWPYLPQAHCTWT